MLNLASHTSPRWTEWALANLEDILVDHAHCEKKAAGAAVKLLFGYPERRFLQEPLSRLAREELGHFEQVLVRLDERGIAFCRQRPSPYGGKLHQLIRRDDPDRLVDLLLIAALIEARSCERLKLLSEALPEPALASFYEALLAAEARHHQLYVELANQLRPPDEIRERLRELATAEAEIIAAPSHWVRLHTSPAEAD
jgi:tRNA-(ms[2]io[6]A)-hydroxylase